MGVDFIKKDANKLGSEIFQLIKETLPLDELQRILSPYKSSSNKKEIIESNDLSNWEKGRALNAVNDHKSAEYFYKEALLEDNIDIKTKLRIQLSLALVYTWIDNPKAPILLQEVIDNGEGDVNNEDINIIKAEARLSLGARFGYEGNHTKAIEIRNEIIEIAGDSEKMKLLRIQATGNIGNSYAKRGFDDDAIGYFLKAVDMPCNSDEGNSFKEVIKSYIEELEYGD